MAPGGSPGLPGQLGCRRKVSPCTHMCYGHEREFRFRQPRESGLVSSGLGERYIESRPGRKREPRVQKSFCSCAVMAWQEFVKSSQILLGLARSHDQTARDIDFKYIRVILFNR